MVVRVRVVAVVVRHHQVRVAVRPGDGGGAGGGDGGGRPGAASLPLLLGVAGAPTSSTGGWGERVVSLHVALRPAQVTVQAADGVVQVLDRRDVVLVRC